MYHHDPLLYVERQTKHIQRNLQVLIDAQSEGLLSRYWWQLLTTKGLLKKRRHDRETKRGWPVPTRGRRAAPVRGKQVTVTWRMLLLSDRVMISRVN
jgi:hypothetical protein